MTDRERLLAAFDAQVRAGASGPSQMRVGSLTVATGPDGGQVVGVAATTETGSLAARLREVFADRGEQIQWPLYGHDRVGDLANRLRDAGFVAAAPETLMVARSRTAARAATDLRGVTARAGAEPDLPAVAAAHAQLLGGAQEQLLPVFTARLASDRWRLFVGDAGGQVVSAGWLDVAPGGDFGVLYGGMTLPQWRGRGGYRAVVAARARAAARRAPLVCVEASEASRQVLAGMGFEELTTVTTWRWAPR
ncbi:hypothetical protein [Pilimelia columellifera]|uniref:hypothetical protein n=1 Tax=Pilimelia columellifera TaxID=706574 RepID=UPI0031D20109